MMPEKKIYLLSALFLFLAAGCTTSSNTEPIHALPTADNVQRFPIDKSQIETFSNSVRPIQGELNAKYDLARHFQRIRKHRIAIETLKEVIAMDPAHAEAYNAMGFSYDCLKDYETAQSHYQMAILLDPEMDHAYNNMGYSYILDGKYAPAIETLKQAIALNDANHKYHKNLGLAYIRTGNKEMATAAFRKIEDTPGTEAIMVRLGLMSNVGQTDDVEESEPPVAVQNNGNEILPRQHAADGHTGQSAIYAENSIQLSPQVVAAATPTKSGVSLVSTSLLTADSSVVVTNKQAAKIEVSNGNGVHRMARTVGNHLKTNGINAIRLTNADRFDHAITVIYYREGFYDEAARIKSLLPGLSNAEHLVAAHLVREPIRVLIGRDLVPFKPHSRSHIEVDVSNGNGVNGMARRLGKHLSEEGFKVGRLTNADHFGYEKSIVFYSKGRLDHARIIADAMPGNNRSRLVELNNKNNRVQVLLGSDMVF